ncbi:MAG TPA: hypothetical protein DF984_05975 [Anaerolineaceae bacterium]|nr:hypothetical protein [Anaerolineaceae bacterium]
MKNLFKTLAIVAVIGIALASTSAVFAQGNTPGNSTDSTAGGAMGNGRRGGNQGYQASETQSGIVHDALITAFAEALGLTVDELNTRLATGETMSEIALSTGMTYDEFVVLLNEIHEQVRDQAMMDGTMTQARVYFSREARTGGMYGLNINRGMGQGLYGTGDCPYID